ncbi:hypothetical protein [Deinococcus alpinitundrae]|uniref:hypothetical protein n=1 Tax=Deinococcus alpinitundrae TaxID=468913 RepID=UPI0013798088|nr:hypothetical protein [Deinococcus alpinitundrae]
MTLITSIAPDEKPTMRLRPLPAWHSPEQFRKNLGDNVRKIERGVVGTLHTKDETIRMLTDDDFQELYGLAREVDRLRDGIEVIIAAAFCVKQNRDDASITVLAKAAIALGRSPVLPTRLASKEFNIRDIPADEVTEADDAFDFENVKRPL